MTVLSFSSMALGDGQHPSLDPFRSKRIVGCHLILPVRPKIGVEVRRLCSQAELSWSPNLAPQGG